MPALKRIASEPWAMSQRDVETLMAISQRENEISPEALEAYESQSHERAQDLRVRDGVAIVDIKGPLFKYANIFTRVSGATSYETAMLDFQAAIDDPNISAVILKVDSPGGQVSGCDELAQAIYNARGKKPIKSYVSGMAASGGYWIASAADEVTVSDVATLGSIGVVMGFSKPDNETIQFVSSQSPNKRPDLTSEDGAKQVQALADQLADVFISAVAKHRNMTTADVVEKFGKGGVEVGERAVAAGMADSVGQFEQVLAGLQNQAGGNRLNLATSGGHVMANETAEAGAKSSASIDEAVTTATNDTKTRIKAITTSDAGKAMPKLAESLAFDSELETSACLKLLDTAKADADAMSKAASDTKSEKDGADKKDRQDAYADMKEDAGAIGASLPDTSDADAKADNYGWGSTVKSINSAC